MTEEEPTLEELNELVDKCYGPSPEETLLHGKLSKKVTSHEKAFPYGKAVSTFLSKQSRGKDEQQK
ncbi:MAG: hypothetical protein WC175_01845 [Candidatus Dojkabacteria bacterium]|jgi:hypothetical protein